MELAKSFVEEQEQAYYWRNFPKLFYLWGHSYEFDNNNNWNVIEEFCEYVGGREDIWYVTNGEIFDYVKAYDNLEFSAQGTFVYNPSALTVYINYYGENLVVEPGKTIELKPKIL